MDKKSKIVQIETKHLQAKLNQFYYGAGGVRSQARPQCFHDLWDLKELAMLEKRSTIDVPQGWLEEVAKFESKWTH